VVSAAMLSALEELGFASAFDRVYGCSSGAINAAYFLAGETWYPVSIYFDDLTTRRFIDFRRGLFGGNVLNLDYAFEEVVEEIKPLDYEGVIASPVPLVVAITDVDAVRTVLVSGFSDRAQLKSALLASAYALSPVSILITAYHGQFDSMMVAGAFLGGRDLRSRSWHQIQNLICPCFLGRTSDKRFGRLLRWCIKADIGLGLAFSFRSAFLAIPSGVWLLLYFTVALLDRLNADAQVMVHSLEACALIGVGDLRAIEAACDLRDRIFDRLNAPIEICFGRRGVNLRCQFVDPC